MLEAAEQTKALISTLVVAMMVVVARTLINDEPMKWKKFFGELILAGVGAWVMFAFGMYQGMEYWQTIFIGGLSGLGGVRGIEWALRVCKQAQNMK